MARMLEMLRDLVAHKGYADQQPFGTIPIAPGAINGEIQLEIPAGTPTMTVLFRAESGGSQAETTLQINAP
jgi:hypothetical protein